MHTNNWRVRHRLSGRRVDSKQDESEVWEVCVEASKKDARKSNGHALLMLPKVRATFKIVCARVYTLYHLYCIEHTISFACRFMFWENFVPFVENWILLSDPSSRSTRTRGHATQQPVYFSIVYENDWERCTYTIQKVCERETEGKRGRRVKMKFFVIKIRCWIMKLYSLCRLCWFEVFNRPTDHPSVRSFEHDFQNQPFRVK